MSSNLKSAVCMVLAGFPFALANSVICTVIYKISFKAQSDAFWPFAIATGFPLPFIWRHVVSAIKIRHPVLHRA